MANGRQSAARRLARFGPFEVDLATGELRKHGIRIKLQTKPFQILQALIESPGIPVSREELRVRLWPDDPFIDFESGLNTAINRLRIALGDDSAKPRYIETIARTGYRLMAAVEIAEHEAPVPAIAPHARAAASSLRRRWVAACAGAIVIAACVLPILRKAPERDPKLRQITFRRGNIAGARFAPDGRSVLYAARWQDETQALYVTDPSSPESRRVGFPGTSLASVSKQGELALLTFGGTMNINGGSLSRVAMNGGAPQETDKQVFSADWSQDGKAFAVARAIDGGSQLEHPAGTIRHRTPGWLSDVRVSREDAVAFIDHPVRHDDAGSVMAADARGVRTLAGGWTRVGGLAWHPVTGEVWFTASREGALPSLWAVSSGGKLRSIAQAPGTITLRDISLDGRVLISRDSRRLEMAGSAGPKEAEKDLSWLDWSRVQDISADGGHVLFDESGGAAGDKPIVYVRKLREGATIRLGEGTAMGILPDASEVLALAPGRRDRLRMIPAGGGPPRDLPSTGIEYQWARLFPDGKRLLALGSQAGRNLDLFVQPLSGPGRTTLMKDTMIRNAAISADGERIAVLTPRGELTIIPSAGGAPRTVPGGESLAPIRWSRDGRLFVQHLKDYTHTAARIFKVDVDTGQLTFWKELSPADRMGLHSITGVAIAAHEGAYVYSYRRFLSELFIADGWR